MLTLTKDELVALRRVQKMNKNKRDYVKASVIIMLAHGDSAEEISSRLGIAISTVYAYQKNYSEVPFEEYFTDNYVGYSGKLSEEQQSEFVSELTENLYASTSEIKEYLKTTFDIDMQSSSISSMMERLNFSYKKTKIVPGKADPEKQQAWIESFEEKTAQATENEIFIFIDGVHPMHNTKSEYAWIKKGQDYEMPSNSGRSRLNINGAINIFRPNEVFIEEEKTINGQSNIRLLNQLIEAYPNKIINVYSDNAGYNHSKVLKEWLADRPQIRYDYIPPYSPNLNPIERLWKLMRKSVINSFYYETFTEFKQAILEFFEGINEYKEKLEKLITAKFEVLA